MKIIRNLLFILATVFLAAYPVFAYTIPDQEFQSKYFYVFGPQGNPYYGADDVDHNQVIFIDVPENEPGDVTVSVFDPDTGGYADYKPKHGSAWSTVTNFSLYGKEDAPLQSREFSKNKEYDRRLYVFGPFAKEKGEKIGSAYRFKLVASGIEGADQNLFNVRITPESAQAFCDKVAFRLLSEEGRKMSFYVEVPAGVSSLIVENYDIDPDGATAQLWDPATRKKYKIKASSSAQWAQTPVEIKPLDKPRRLVYMLTKKTQHYANAQIRVRDASGNILPIYFNEGKTFSIKSTPKPHVKAVVPELNCRSFTFDATDSYDPNNDKLTYLWNFGDGSTDNKPVVTHTYAHPGEYNVSLTVKDSSGLHCDTSVTTQKVNANNAPLPSFEIPDSACLNSRLTLDASATTDNTPGLLEYIWDFGDGTGANGKKLEKKYEKSGVYNIRLTVDDKENTPCSQSYIEKKIRINSAPEANAGEDIDICLPVDKDYLISFSGLKSQDPDADRLIYTWNFGDGTIAAGPTAAHTYKKGGVYIVELTVNDASGTSCSTSKDTVTVRINKPPVAIVGKNMVCCANQDSLFDGSGSYDPDGNKLDYTWDFGDGESARGARVSHRYKKSGTYTISLKVDDGSNTACSSSTASFKAEVNESPVSVMKVR